MPGVQGSMPLKHDPTVDLITAKPNKQKSISAGKVKEEEEKKEEIRSKRSGVVFAAVGAEERWVFEVYMPWVLVHCLNKSAKSEW